MSLKQRLNTEAFRVVGLFVLFGSVWILLTKALNFLSPDLHAWFIKFEVYIAFIFLLFASVIIYIILKKEIIKKKNYESILELEKNKYKTLFETANDGIIILDDQNRISDCNARTLELFGCTREQILKQKPSNLSPKYQWNKERSKELMEYKMNIAREGTPIKFEWLHTRYDHKKFFYAEVSLNKIGLDGVKTVVAVVRDITEEKRIIQQIKESEEKYRLLVENSPSVFWISDRHGTVSYISPNVSKVIGYAVEEIYEKGHKIWLDRIHKSDLPYVVSNFRSIFSENKKCDVTYRIRHRNGKWVWLNTVEEKSLNYLGQEVVYGVSTDITEKKHTQQKVLHAMINAEERERNRIAKDLHDGISPVLSTLKLFIELMHENNNEKVSKELYLKIDETIKEAISGIHEISNNISPHILQNFGLLEAVESFVSRLSDFSKIKILIHSNIDGRFSEIIETAFYRITTELINNSLKHANAKNISINYEAQSDVLNMTFEDDGIGFDIGEVMEKRNGMGLFNISNRIKALQGYFDIQNKPSEGIFVQISIPLEN